MYGDILKQKMMPSSVSPRFSALGEWCILFLSVLIFLDSFLMVK